MADVARCTCPHDSTGHKTGRNKECPFHGDSHKDPLKPYVLTVSDREKLKELRIAVTDSAEIEAVRKADEDRFRRD